MPAFAGNRKRIAIPCGATLGAAIIGIFCNGTTAKRMLALVISSRVGDVNVYIISIVCHNSILRNKLG
jgi:hypothetical protein